MQSRERGAAPRGRSAALAARSAGLLTLGLALAGFLALAPLLVAAHSTHEALELEQHLLNDEGTDVMESYGGYDVNDVFLGAAHRPDLGQGEAGDGIYFRIELYGRVTETANLQPWTVTLSFQGPGGPVSRTITTTDGTNFTSDLDALEYAIDTNAHEVRIERAFILNTKAGLAPGDKLTELQVTTRYGSDLRDVAPGDLYVPNTGGRLTYKDPTAIAGKGVLQADVRVPSVHSYFGPLSAAAGPGSAYTLNVTSGLHHGGQHILLAASSPPGWSFQLHSGGGEVAGNGSTEFTFTANHTGATQPLRLHLTTDVGGRLEGEVAPDGTLRIADAEAGPTPPPARSSPAAAAGLAALGLVGAAWARKR